MREREQWATWANGVTMLRLVSGLVVFAYAADARDETWNYIGLGLYWVLDVLDGFLARRFDQETRIGAQMDILADRVLVAFFYLNYATLHPDLIVPVAMFLFQFMGIDHFLSNQFMRWPIKSPNYFYVIDRTLWRWNWSHPGKALNSGLFAILLLVTGWMWLGLAIATALLIMKCVSLGRLLRIGIPVPR